MNSFSFILSEAQKGLMLAVFYGMAMGFLLGFIRFLTMTFFERREA